MDKKQKLLLEYLVSSPDIFALTQRIVDPSYFDPEFRKSVEFIMEYYEKYSALPSPSQIDAESGVELTLHDIDVDTMEYAADEIETFCSEAAMVQAVLKCPELIKTGRKSEIHSLIEKAYEVSLVKNLGVRYFENVDDRLERMQHESPVMSTGWRDVDDVLFGGISRKELLLVSANSGGGKSITLSNLCYNFIVNKYNVLYVSLELSEDVIAQRFDTMFTGISRRDWRSHVNEIVTRVETTGRDCGHLDIVQMPSGTRAMDIKAYLKEYHLQYKMMPDLLVIDYIDKMSPNEKVSASDVWTKDKLCSEQARDLGVVFNMAIATASQLNRSAVNATEHDHSQISGGISKINEADVYWSIIMNDIMKAQGRAVFIMQKTRNSDGVGKTVHMKWDNRTLRILDGEGIQEAGTEFVPQTKSKEDIRQQLSDKIFKEQPTGNGLLDLMDS